MGMGGLVAAAILMAICALMPLTMIPLITYNNEVFNDQCFLPRIEFKLDQTFILFPKIIEVRVKIVLLTSSWS